MRRTKIVATVGPASESPAVLTAMVAAGMDVVRLNLSHGVLSDHLDRLARVREVAEGSERHIAVIADLPGPKIRSGAFPAGGIELQPGARVVVSPGTGTSSVDVVSVDYPTLRDDVGPGDRIVLGDGAIVLRVESTTAVVECVVETGGMVQGRPGVHLPSAVSRMASPTTDDIEVARQMVDAGVDFVALSFVRSGADVETLRAALAPRDVAIIAKIETTAALDHLDEIVEVADAVMIARGDLGLECPLEDVPHLQKRIIETCVEAGVPVITATQMLESMTTAPAPTRAEVADVANAVLDGTDALMLSGETAVGVDPARVVTTMARIAERADRSARDPRRDPSAARSRAVDAHHDAHHDAEPITRAVTRAAWQASRELDVEAILCATRSGRTGRAMARFRPECPLVGLSADPRTLRALALVWGVRPVAIDTVLATDDLVEEVVARALHLGLVRRERPVIVIAGEPDRADRAATDTLRIVTPR